MPFEGLPHTELVSCPICFKVFNEKEYRPISLRCGHSVCKSCLNRSWTDGSAIQRCPFDQKELPREEDLPATNYALMQLVGAMMPSQDVDEGGGDDQNVPDHPSCYRNACQCIVDMALHLKPLTEGGSDDDSDSCDSPPPPLRSQHPSSTHLRSGTPGKGSRCVLSRPLQRKLISLVHCQLIEEEGRSRAARIARSLGERVVSELLILHQFPHQLSANLWAAVRTRGCQFLGPAMQEEVLRLILLALEDGSFLSRKVLVLFVVQKLEGKYPQASKTAIGHVVQLLYRASCFKVMKRDEESSLMQLKDEFRQYESLRREHDSQIVQIALETGLRISPEQWSSLLYGDPMHKSHMQSIIDKHQSPQSFAQSLSELMGTLERVGDPKQLHRLQPQLEFLSKIDPSPDCPAPSWENIEAIMRSLKTCINMFGQYLSSSDQHRQRLEASAPAHNGRYKTSKCRDFVAKGSCPRGSSCTFAHSQEELDRYRSRSRRTNQRNLVSEGSTTAGEKTSSSLSPSESDQLRQIQLMSRLKLDESTEAKQREQGPLESSASVQPASRTSLPAPVPPSGALGPLAIHLPPPPPPGPPYRGTAPQQQVSGLMQSLDPDKPPFFPLGVKGMPPTRLTFSKPAHVAPEAVHRCQAGHQSAFHPNSPCGNVPAKPVDRAGPAPCLTGPPPGYPYTQPPTAEPTIAACYPDQPPAANNKSLSVPVDSASCVIPPSSGQCCEADPLALHQSVYPSGPQPDSGGEVPQVMPYILQTPAVGATQSPILYPIMPLASQQPIVPVEAPFGTGAVLPPALHSQTAPSADHSLNQFIIWDSNFQPAGAPLPCYEIQPVVNPLGLCHEAFPCTVVASEG